MRDALATMKRRHKRPLVRPLVRMGFGGVALALLLSFGGAQAQEAATKAPPSNAPPVTGKEAAAALREGLAAAMRTTGPGCAAGIASGGRLLASMAAGLANLELSVPMTTEMAFDIGSASKQFTALSAAILSRRGQLDLDADIRVYLPDLHPFDPPIRVRHLVHHSSGLPDVYEPLEWQFGDRDANRYPSDLTLRMARGISRLKFEPGTQFEYSNLGYLLLGQIVEKVSGQTLRTFADANIFKPLGMTRTAFRDDPRELVPNRASAYSLKPDGKTWEWRHSIFNVMGDGGVYSTLADLAIWTDFFADPSKLEGGAELLKIMLSPGEYTEKKATYRGRSIDYGFGIQMFEHRGERVIGHPGGWAGYATVPYYFPARNFAVITLCNVQRVEVLNAVLDTGATLSARRQ